MNAPAKVFLIALIAVSAATNASADVPSIKRRTPYGEVRISLAASGYKPVHRADADTCFKEDQRCMGKPEMLHCSGMGLGVCVFLWRKGRNLIEVMTVGEGEPIVERVRCRSGCR
jgi:hypothetical protein